MMRRPLLLMLAMMLALAGCGTEPTRRADPAEVARELTLTLDRGDDGYDQAMDYWRQVNDSLVRCMADGGLTYQPYVDQWAVDRRIALGLSREEFVQRYGYGLTTLIDYLPLGARRVDPNLTALRQMTPERRKSYQSRLTSCRRDARQKFGPSPHTDTSAMTAEESDRMDEILAAVDKDPGWSGPRRSGPGASRRRDSPAATAGPWCSPRPPSDTVTASSGLPWKPSRPGGTARRSAWRTSSARRIWPSSSACNNARSPRPGRWNPASGRTTTATRWSTGNTWPG
ncbi:hypothetical protein GCM10027614_34190 [Micromonospora vulcania]